MSNASAENKKRVGERLRDARERNELSANELAASLRSKGLKHVSAQQIYAIEHGKAQLPESYALTCASILSVPVRELSGDNLAPEVASDQVEGFSFGAQYMLTNVLINVAEQIYDPLNTLKDEYGRECEPEKIVQKHSFAETLDFLHAILQFVVQIQKERYPQRLGDSADVLEMHLLDALEVVDTERGRLRKALDDYDRDGADDYTKFQLALEIRKVTSALDECTRMLRDAIDACKVDLARQGDFPLVEGQSSVKQSLLIERVRIRREAIIREHLKYVIEELGSQVDAFGRRSRIRLLDTGTDSQAASLEWNSLAKSSWKICSLSQDALLKISSLTTGSDSAEQAYRSMNQFVADATKLLGSVPDQFVVPEEDLRKLRIACDHVDQRLRKLETFVNNSQ